MNITRRVLLRCGMLRAATHCLSSPALLLWSASATCYWSRVGEKNSLDTSLGRPRKHFFLSTFGALLTPVDQPDIVETIHLSRTCITVVTRLLCPCLVRAVVCCSLLKFFGLLGFSVRFFLQLTQLAQISNFCIIVPARANQLNQPKRSRQKLAK